VRSHVRFSLLALVAGAIVAAMAPAAAQAAFGVGKFFAANCKTAACEPGTVTKNPVTTEGFTQAGGHPPFGITDFKVKTEGTGKPEGTLTHIRTDVAPGVSTNPEAVRKCTAAEFGTEAPGTGLFLAPTGPCSTESIIGTNNVVLWAGGPLPITGALVYNLEQPTGLSSEFGVAVPLPSSITKVVSPQLYAHTLIEGHVEWASDYHDYFEIKVSPSLPLVSSRLSFEGNIGKGKEPIGSGGFLTNPTSCTGEGPQTTSKLTLESETGEKSTETYMAPLGAENCEGPPFAPKFALTTQTTAQDVPDGITTDLSLLHDLEPGAGHVDSSQLRTAVFTLPEGMTMNPSAAHGLEACTPAQARIHSLTPGVACPGGSKIGTVTLNVPGLPAGSLKGELYLGGPESGPITGPPYTIYLDAESSTYGISVRLKGLVVPNETTGQLTTTFSENPEQPFSEAILHFNTGALAPIANPLTCGTATTTTTLTPFSGKTPPPTAVGPFTVDSNGSGGACASPLPFALSQSTEYLPNTAGAHTNYNYSLARADGQQYLSQVKVVLPPGLVGAIPTVTQCGEAQANAGTCSPASRIGTASVLAGAGPTPYPFSGPVYLTGPYNGAPFGLSIVVPAVAGPFNLGNVVTRSTINVDPSTTRVTVNSVLPTIVKGVPMRLKNISVDTNKQGFLFNPTNCSLLATESTVTSTLGATQSLSTPFQAENCSALAFKPTFKSTAGGKTSKANGASLETTINQPAGEANLKSVLVQLPKQLPSRLTTLNKACPEKTFATNPYSCDAGAFVGTGRANTPTLPGKLQGPAILVSHGGEAFPDLDLVMEANGVRVIVVGNTKITKGITTTDFKTTPDVPVSSVTVLLPTGPHSALAANGNLCTSSLVMPTTITAQNGKTFKQSTKIAVKNCPVQIVGKKVVGNTAYLTIRTFEAGRISGSGPNLSTVARHLGSAQKQASLKVPLSGGGRSKGRPLSVRVRVGFFPKKHGAATSVAYTTVTFR
jgi:hypothetical protein